MESTTKLCVFCRQLEPISQQCSTPETFVPPKAVSPLRPHEEAMLMDLQKQPSVVCQRCSEYDIIRVFRDAEAMDGINRTDVERKTKEDNINFHEMMDRHYKLLEKYRMDLGQLSSLILSPACPVCRLIFRILPREGLSPMTDNIRIAPFRSYLQHTGWEKLVDEYHTTAAIFLGVDNTAGAVANMAGSRLGSDNSLKQSEMAGEAISLATPHTFPSRKAGNAKFVEPLVDISLPRRALDNCIKNHGSFCEVGKPPELKHIRVIDVDHRTVVPYPDGCDYFALSYVWGGVMPTPGALEAGTLPQTLEDAITVTKKMGWHYLWVDALCIDQTQHPTPEQKADKEQQLKMMDMIYSSATLTLIAMAGTNSNVGLPGVIPTNPRVTQIKESIGGLTFFTVPPTVTAERTVSTWASRAWTLQEEVLSRRHLIFTTNQLEFHCSRQSIPESLDTDTLAGWVSPLPEILDMLVPGAYQPTSLQPSQTPLGEDYLLSDVYWLITSDYTSRSMTNDGDSLNALLGLLNVWERTLLPSGCIWGLPLTIYPPSLGWMHPRSVAAPRRRVDFPSWSWTGWAGEVSIDALLLPGNATGARICDPVRDMSVAYVGVTGKELTVEAWAVALEICTEPFSEVFVPGTSETLMGMVVERNFLHPNTLPSGTYRCLVVERVTYRIRADGPIFQKVFMIVLDGDGVTRPAQRRTIITLSTVAGGDFMCVGPLRRRVTLM